MPPEHCIRLVFSSHRLSIGLQLRRPLRARPSLSPRSRDRCDTIICSSTLLLVLLSPPALHSMSNGHRVSHSSALAAAARSGVLAWHPESIRTISNARNALHQVLIFCDMVMEAGPLHVEMSEHRVHATEMHRLIGLARRVESEAMSLRGDSADDIAEFIGLPQDVQHLQNHHSNFVQLAQDAILSESACGGPGAKKLTSLQSPQCTATLSKRSTWHGGISLPTTLPRRHSSRVQVTLKSFCCVPKPGASCTGRPTWRLWPR